jgi:hypothetical protein
MHRACGGNVWLNSGELMPGTLSDAASLQKSSGG